MDNRKYNRLAFAVLEHVTQQGNDVHLFLKEFQRQLQNRQCLLCGITTDGSPLYPKVFLELWPEVPHQVCEFHVLKEITKAILHALAKLRKETTAEIPKLPRGQPRRERQGLARLILRQKQGVAELFEHRYLLVRHHPSVAQQEQLRKQTYGRPDLRTLHQIMEEVC